MLYLLYHIFSKFFDISLIEHYSISIYILSILVKPYSKLSPGVSIYLSDPQWIFSNY